MTTATFAVMTPRKLQVLAAVKTEHCKPPSFKPQQDVRGTMKCTCGGVIKYFVRAANGMSNGTCSGGCGVRWQE